MPPTLLYGLVSIQLLCVAPVLSRRELGQRRCLRGARRSSVYSMRPELWLVVPMLESIGSFGSGCRA
ncbi:Uncharacterised protein [Vibrio cholerae]|nr:Uncharacterised protein [Vibrio cholerae]